MFSSPILRNVIPQFKRDTFYLWVWYANKIPPHIGCSINDKYFSLKVSGKDEDLDPQRVLDLIRKKRISFLLIETQVDTDLNKVQEVYGSYQRASENVSCLQPILNIAGDPSGVNKLSDFITHLNIHDRIKCIFGLNLPDDYKGIPEYSLDDIKRRLLMLEHAEK